MYLPIGLAWFATDHCYGFRDRMCDKVPVTPVHVDCQPTDVWNREESPSVQPSHQEHLRHHHHHHGAAQSKTHAVMIKDEVLNQGITHDNWMDFLGED